MSVAKRVTIDTAPLPAMLTQLRLPTIARLWQAITETAGIRNKSGNRCAERNTGLLDRGDGRGSDVLLAMFRASHDVLKDEAPESS